MRRSKCSDPIPPGILRDITFFLLPRSFYPYIYFYENLSRNFINLKVFLKDHLTNKTYTANLISLEKRRINKLEISLYDHMWTITSLFALSLLNDETELIVNVKIG